MVKADTFRMTELLALLVAFGFAGHRKFLTNFGIVALSYAGLFAWISGSPFVLRDLYGLSPFEFSVAFAAGARDCRSTRRSRHRW